MLSKFDNMPLDKLEDQRIDARDGALYNVCIQGPALTTTWTGDPSMEVLPMDKVFVVVVADLIIGKLQLSEQLPVGPAIADATPNAAAQTAAYNSFKNAIDNLTTFRLIPVYSFATIEDTGKGAFDGNADFLDKLKGAQIVSVVGNWFPYDDAAGPQAWAIATTCPEIRKPMTCGRRCWPRCKPSVRASCSTERAMTRHSPSPRTWTAWSPASKMPTPKQAQDRP